MSHTCTQFWSAFASGGQPKCVECDPPGPSTKVRKRGIRVGNRVLNRADLERAIRESNERGEYADLLDSLGPQFEGCTPPPADRVVPGRLHQKRLLVGARYVPKVGRCPPPELIMDPESPFWHDRKVEDESRSGYTSRVAKPKRDSGPKETSDAPVEGALRKRRGKRR